MIHVVVVLIWPIAAQCAERVVLSHCQIVSVQRVAITVRKRKNCMRLICTSATQQEIFV
jgi:hypothetical protein